MTRHFDVAVIGGGANGLTAATVLARAGLRVLLLEASANLGGQSQTIEFAPGFRVAPFGHDPGWLPPFVRAELGIVPPPAVAEDPGVTVAAEPGRFLTLARDARVAAEAIRPWSAVDADAWPGFATRLDRMAGFLETLYSMPAPDVNASGLEDGLALLSLGRRFRGLGGAAMTDFLRTLPMSVWELLDDTFESPVVKAGIAPGGIQDHRQGPRSGGTGFVLLHHRVGGPAGSVRGRMPWREGPDAFTHLAAAAARQAGVTIRTEARVERIEVQRDAVAGIGLAGGETISVRRVVSTASPARTLLDWVGPEWLDPEFRLAVSHVRHRGCTAFVFYGLDALPELRGLDPRRLGGLVSLTSNLVALERAADAAKYGEVSETPHIEICAPTVLWPEMAPANRHVLLARVQYAPYHVRAGEWDDRRGEALARTVDRVLEAWIPGFSSHVLHEDVWSPRDLEQRLGLYEGAPSHGELGLDQILFMRPVPGWSRHATPVAGLYLGGAGTHPGPGILGGPGCLAARRLLADRGRTRHQEVA